MKWNKPNGQEQNFKPEEFYAKVQVQSMKEWNGANATTLWRS